VDDPAIVCYSCPMKFSAMPESVHPDFVVRPMESRDIEIWYDYLTLPAVFQHTSWSVTSANELATYIWSPETFEPATKTRFAIATRGDDKLAGTIGFHTVSPQNRSAEIAYDLAPEVWGRGLATYACGLLVGWAHTHIGICRIQAAVLESNVRSARVLDRCGFEKEGLLRQYRMVRGTPGNFFMYSHIA